MSVMDQFIRYADSKGIVRRNIMILKSKNLFEKAVYGSIIYNMLEMNDYIQFMNYKDPTINKAVELFNAKLTKPTLNGKTTNKKSYKTKKK